MKHTRIAALIIASSALTACGSGTIQTVAYTPAATITAPVDVPVASAGPIYVSPPTVTAHPRPTTTQTPAPLVTRKPRPVQATPTIVTDPPAPVVTANPRPAQPMPTITSTPAEAVYPTPDTGSAAEPNPTIPSVVISAAPHIERGGRATACPEEDPESCTPQPTS